MKPKAILTVWTKELRDSIRDRRTLFSIFILPALLFPLITFIGMTVANKVVKKAKAEIAAVMVIGGQDSPRLMERLGQQTKIKLQPASDNWRQLVSDKKVRAVVEIPPGFDADTSAGRLVELRIFHYEGEMRSGFAVGELRRALTDYREQLAQDRLAERGLSSSLLKPFSIQSQNVAPPEKVGGNLLGGLIPYLFILISFSSAMYPAIDLTAGEKERGTMETVLCSPVSRLNLALGKFLMVLTASLASILCSLLSMGLSFLVGGLAVASFADKASLAAKATAQSAAMPFSFDPLGFVGILILVLPLAGLFSAVQLAIALYAKSTKEAQSLLTPLVVVILIPAMMALLPGVELNLKLALVPILNLALACKEMLSGVWNWSLLLLIFGSNIVYAVAALAFCVRQFKREDVIFRT